jgi:hypothetical protein
MYIECKAESLQGPARIGRVTYSKTGKTIYYQGREFFSVGKSGYKYNWIEVTSGDQYWISGPRRDGEDRLYGPSALPVEIDEDAREEYWREIRKKPELVSRCKT